MVFEKIAAMLAEKLDCDAAEIKMDVLSSGAPKTLERGESAAISLLHTHL